jgi:hypothetical protein
MTMSSDIERDTALQSPQYADEVLCANWSPLVTLLAEPLARAQKSVLEGIDVETFLARLYLCQRA